MSPVDSLAIAPLAAAAVTPRLDSSPTLPGDSLQRTTRMNYRPSRTALPSSPASRRRPSTREPCRSSGGSARRPTITATRTARFSSRT